MITREQLEDYLAGRLDSGTQACLEEELADDPQALRELLVQEKIDTALRMLLGRTGRGRVIASIAAVVQSECASTVKLEVLRDVRVDGRRRRRRSGAWNT